MRIVIEPRSTPVSPQSRHSTGSPSGKASGPEKSRSRVAPAPGSSPAALSQKRRWNTSPPRKSHTAAATTPRDRKTDASGARARPRECDVGGGDVEGGYPIRRSAFGEGEGEAPGAAPDIEHAAMIRWSRELRKRRGEQTRPP